MGSEPPSKFRVPQFSNLDGGCAGTDRHELACNSPVQVQCAWAAPRHENRGVGGAAVHAGEEGQ
eukprot:6285631-Pyramimonas_sp.AAC.1